jgi:hypothetical protein
VTPRQWALAFGLILTLVLVWMAPDEAADPPVDGRVGASELAEPGALKGGANRSQSSAQPPVIALRLVSCSPRHLIRAPGLPRLRLRPRRGRRPLPLFRLSIWGRSSKTAPGKCFLNGAVEYCTSESAM